MKRRISLVLLGTTVALSGCGGSGGSDASDSARHSVERPDPEALMFDACTNEVLTHLKAPATATFPDSSTARYESPDPSGYEQTRVYGYVDAQNGFGALIRSEWSCSASLDSDGTDVRSVSRLVVGGQPYF
jgi:hypothetical protein